MITTLTGPNSYLLQQALHGLIDSFVATYTDLGLEQFDGEQLDPARLPSVIQALPFLASRRLVVLKQPSAQKVLQEQLEKLLVNVSDTTDLVLVEPALDKRTSYYKLLQQKTNLQTFGELAEPALARWLVDQAAQQAAHLSLADANYLVQRVGTDQAYLANELQKLINFNPQINRASIDELTAKLPRSSVFDLLDAAFAGQAARALAIYQDQRLQNVDPQAMLAMITWQLHILALVKTAGQRNPGEIAAQAKVSPYVLRKSLAMAGQVSLAKLKQWVRAAYVLDVRLKSEPLNADEALQNYLLSLAN